MINDVATFLTACGQTTHKHDVRQLALYIGLQCEELGEKLCSILGPDHLMVKDLFDFSILFKQGAYDDSVNSADPVKLFDADVDLTWVSLGAALSLGVDVQRGWDILTKNNMSKIDPCTGVVLKDANGKVMKPAGFQPPDFSVLFSCNA